MEIIIIPLKRQNYVSGIPNKLTKEQERQINTLINITVNTLVLWLYITTCKPLNNNGHLSSNYDSTPQYYNDK